MKKLSVVVVAVLVSVFMAGCEKGGSGDSAQSSSTIFDDHIKAHQKAKDLEKEMLEAAEKRAEQMP